MFYRPKADINTTSHTPFYRTTPPSIKGTCALPMCVPITVRSAVNVDKSSEAAVLLLSSNDSQLLIAAGVFMDILARERSSLLVYVNLPVVGCLTVTASDISYSRIRFGWLVRCLENPNRFGRFGFGWSFTVGGGRLVGDTKTLGSNGGGGRRRVGNYWK